MKDLPRKPELLAYVRTFFPDGFEIGLEQSGKRQDYRVLSIRDSISGLTASYEGPAFAILDICSLSDIAYELHARLRREAQHQPMSVENRSKRA